MTENSQDSQEQDAMAQIETMPEDAISEESSESAKDASLVKQVTSDCDDAVSDTMDTETQDDVPIADATESTPLVRQVKDGNEPRLPKINVGKPVVAVAVAAIALAGLGFALGQAMPAIVGGTETSPTATEATASTGAVKTPGKESAVDTSPSQVRFQSSDELADYIWKRSEARMRAEDSKMTTAQKAIVKSAKETGPSGASMCLSWVNDVFERSGWEFERLWAASEACETWCHSTDRNDLEPGMIVAVESTETSPMAGHIGIYIGHGMIRDNETWGGEGIVMTRPVDEWLEMFGKVATPRWGWAGDYDLTDTKTRPRVIEKDVDEERIPESEG